MSLRTKTRERLYQMHTYRPGRVEAAALRGFFHTIEKVQGHNVSIPDLQISSFTAQTSTGANVDASGTGRLYAVWANSPVGSTLDTIVQVLDNTVVIGSFKIKSTRSSEVYYFDSVDGVGIEYGTSLIVKAVAAADGSSNPAAGDRPDLVVIWGDDAINTTDSSLINTNYS